MTDTSAHSYEADPRTQLADSFRDFMIQAIKQQETMNLEAVRTGKEEQPAAGHLWKIDERRLKILLAEPAHDELLDSETGNPEQPVRHLPLIWAAVELPGEAHPLNQLTHTEDEVEEQASRLEIVVFSAEEIFIKRVYTSEGRIEKNRVGDQRFVPDFEANTVEELLAMEAPSKKWQIERAAKLLAQLPYYDLRTIASNTTEAA